jgi:hypothetical protein
MFLSGAISYLTTRLLNRIWTYRIQGIELRFYTSQTLSKSVLVRLRVSQDIPLPS